MSTVTLPTSGRRSGTGAITVGFVEPAVVGLAFSGRQATPAPLSAQIATVPPPAARNEPAITVDLWNENDTNRIGPVENSNARQWQDTVTNLGSASLSVPIGSDAERVAANTLSPGRHLRFKYQGRNAFTARIEASESTRLDRDHSALRSTVRAVDKRVVLDRHKVKPKWPIESLIDTDTRTFGWHSIEQLTASWKKATVVQPAISLAWQLPNTDPPFFQPWEPPKGWATLFTPIIQPRPGIVMPVGKWGARRTFSVTTEGWYMIQLAVMGGRAELFLNSTKIAETAEDSNGWLTPLEVVVPLTPTFTGAVIVGVGVEKYDYPQTGNLPGTLANFYRRSLFSLAMFRLPNGPATTVTSGMKVFQTDDQWQVLDYPARFPAPTVGRIVRQLLAEAGLPSNFTRGFTDTHDTAGRLWPLNDETTFRDSDSIWDALQQLRAKGYESKMSTNGYRLDIWGPENFPGSTPIRVQSAQQIEQPTLPNRLIVQWARGRFIEERPAAERIEAKLNLGEVRTRQEARAIAAAELNRNELRADRWMATPALSADDEMYKNFRSRDWVKISGNGENVDLKVEGITVTEDADLFPSAQLELTSPLEFLDEALQRKIDRMGAGAVGDSASPARWLEPNVRTGFTQVERIPEFSQGAIVTFPDEGGDSTAHTFDVPTRISLIRITAVSNPNVVGPGIQVRVRRGNQNLEPILWLSPGSNHAVYLPNYLIFQPGENISCRMIDASEGAGLVAVSFHAAVAAPGAVRPEKPFPWL